MLIGIFDVPGKELQPKKNTTTLAIAGQPPSAPPQAKALFDPEAPFAPAFVVTP